MVILLIMINKMLSTGVMSIPIARILRAPHDFVEISHLVVGIATVVCLNKLETLRIMHLVRSVGIPGTYIMRIFAIGCGLFSIAMFVISCLSSYLLQKYDLRLNTIYSFSMKDDTRICKNVSIYEHGSEKDNVIFINCFDTYLSKLFDVNVFVIDKNMNLTKHIVAQEATIERSRILFNNIHYKNIADDKIPTSITIIDVRNLALDPQYLTILDLISMIGRFRDLNINIQKYTFALYEYLFRPITAFCMMLLGFVIHTYHGSLYINIAIMAMLYMCYDSCIKVLSTFLGEDIIATSVPIILLVFFNCLILIKNHYKI